MKTFVVILICFSALISCNSNFLRNLAYAFSDANFGEAINNKCTSATPVGKTFTLAYTTEGGDNCNALTGTLRVKDATAGTNDLTYTGTPTSSPVTATIADASSKLLDNALYRVDTASCDSNPVTLTKNENYYAYASKHVALGTSTAAQTVDYSKDDSQTFKITYTTTSQTDKPLKEVQLTAGTETKKLTTECTFASSVLTCTPTEEKLPGSTEGIAYTVKVVNLCGYEEPTGITVTVKSASSPTPTPAGSSYLSISKIILAIGMFLL